MAPKKKRTSFIVKKILNIDDKQADNLPNDKWIYKTLINTAKKTDGFLDKASKTVGYGTITLVAAGTAISAFVVSIPLSASIGIAALSTAVGGLSGAKTVSSYKEIKKEHVPIIVNSIKKDLLTHQTDTFMDSWKANMAEKKKDVSNKNNKKNSISKSFNNDNKTQPDAKKKINNTAPAPKFKK